MTWILVFDTTHDALWAEETARDAGIPAEVIPAPPAAQARCNLALQALPEDMDRLKNALQEAGVPFGSYAPETTSPQVENASCIQS